MIEKPVREAVARLGLDVEDMDDESVQSIRRHMGLAPAAPDQRELDREVMRARWQKRQEAHRERFVADDEEPDAKALVDAAIKQARGF